MPDNTMQTFNISNVIDEKLIALDLDVRTKEEMLNRLTDLFDEQGKLNDRDAFFKDVLWREGEGQTGIGMRVAMLLAHESFIDQLHAVKTPHEMLTLLESDPEDFDD